jgi:hypothetical protein
MLPSNNDRDSSDFPPIDCRWLFVRETIDGSKVGGAVWELIIRRLRVELLVGCVPSGELAFKASKKRDLDLLKITY